MTEAELTSFEQSAGKVLKPALALAGAASPVTAAATFGLGMVFRLLKLRARITKAKEDAAKENAKAVGAMGLVRIPVIVGDPVATLKNIFVRDPFFAASFPEVARQFRAEIDVLRKPGSTAAAVETMQVVRQVILPVLAGGEEPRKFADDSLQALFGDLLAKEPPELRQIVTEMLTLHKDRNAERDDAVINEELIRMQAGLALDRLEDMQEASEIALANVVRQAVAAELLGTSGAINASADFVGKRRIAALGAEIAAEQAEVDKLKAVAAPSDEQKAKLASGQAKIKSLQADKAAMEEATK